MISPVKQQDKNCCTLAGIESLTIDKQRHRTQQQIIDDFPAWCRKDQWDEHGDGTKHKKDGPVDLLAFFHILRSMKLASSFEVGTGRACDEDRKSRLHDGIFLCTTTHHDGSYGSFHCVRLENPRVDDFYVVEPSQIYPHAYRPVLWDSPDFRGAVVIVCIPEQTGS
jgi:hypothetical protein